MNSTARVDDDHAISYDKRPMSTPHGTKTPQPTYRIAGSALETPTHLRYYSIFFLSSYSSFSPNCARSNVVEYTNCWMVSIRGRLLSSTIWPALLWVLGHITSLATANIRYSSKLFIPLLLWGRGDDAMASQPLLCVVFLERESPHLQRRVSQLSLH